MCRPSVCASRDRTQWIKMRLAVGRVYHRFRDDKHSANEPNSKFRGEVSGRVRESRRGVAKPARQVARELRSHLSQFRIRRPSEGLFETVVDKGDDGAHGGFRVRGRFKTRRPSRWGGSKRGLIDEAMRELRHFCVGFCVFSGPIGCCRAEG